MEKILVRDKDELLEALQNLDINKTTEITLLLQTVDDKRHHLVRFKTGTVYIINSLATCPAYKKRLNLKRNFGISFIEIPITEKIWRAKVKKAISHVKRMSEKKLFKA